MKFQILKLSSTILFVILLTQSVFAQKYTLSGYVKDKDTGETLIGANVYNKKDYQGTVSNTYGFYSITLPQDSIHLIVSFVGYKPIEATIYLDKDIEFNVELSNSFELEEIVVVSTEEEIQQETQMSSITIPIKQIQSLPALMGEVDVLKVLQLLPGVQSGSEGSSGIYVRGGGPDQNLILLDGVPIYNASHLFGFFSVFNADAINNVELIKGGFPARYGGRLSSVIDISMKEGNNQEFKGSASIGLISSKITLESPIKSENTTFILSARRTYIDVLAAPIIKAASENGETGGYYFYDLNAKINHKFSNKDRIYLSTYLGNDKAYAKSKGEYINNNVQTNYKDEFGLAWGNVIVATRWNHLFNPKLFSNVTLNYSKYQFKVFESGVETTITPTDKETSENELEYVSGIRDFSAKIDFDYIPNPNHYVRFGINGIRHQFNPGILAYTDTRSEIDTTTSSFRKSTNEFAAYIEDDFKIGTKLKINAGLHFSGFQVDKQFYASLQPRLAMRYLLNNGLALKASYARMTQFIHLLTNSGIGLPTDLWVPSTKRVKPQQSTQYAVGLAKTVNDNFEVSLEAYYKDMQNLIEYKDGASFTSIEKDWQDKVEIGKGSSYGMELLIQKKQGKLTGWLGYTLSWTNRQFDNINFGKEFPYRYDRRHDISLTAVYQVKENVEIAGVWVYGTGNSVSLPTKSYRQNSGGLGFDLGGGSSVNYYENRNGFRMKAYHRLDFSITWSKQKKRGVRKWTLGVYNAYNARNPFFIQVGYDYETDKKNFIQYSLLPFLPSFSYKFDF